jgi:hypothetical protein
MLASASQTFGMKPRLYRRSIPYAAGRGHAIGRFVGDEIRAALDFEPNANGHRDD